MAEPRVRPDLRALALAGILLATGLLAGVTSSVVASGDTVELMVLGETHGTRQVTRDLIRIAEAKGATGCVCPGDFIYGHWSTTPSEWKKMMSPFMGLMLPAQGNHDTPWSDWKDIFPGGRPYYSQTVNGVLFVALNPEHSVLTDGTTQREWLEDTLAATGPEKQKVVFLHRPWWLPYGAKHAAWKFQDQAKVTPAEMDGLMKKHGVDLVVSGHEKGYQHSYRNGIHYVVAGGGGGDTPYPQDYELEGAVYRTTGNIVSTLEITGSGMTFKSYDRSWNKVEQFTMTAGSTGGSTPSGDLSATFTPYNGNEWWVQTKVKAGEGIASVDARVNGGSWKALTLRSWGAWAAGIHAPSGSIVEFRATGSSGAQAVSGKYAWPDATPVSSSVLKATFTPYNGNEWWVQTKVSASESLKSVEARVNGGSWKPLTLRSWGAWAAGIHAPSGSIVEFRATGSSGVQAVSGKYVWPDATPVGFDASFTPYNGGETWVQTRVSATASLKSVDARVNGGSWQPLTYRSWDAWAAGIHAPTGSTVDFRATSETGAHAYSGKYVWPVK